MVSTNKDYLKQYIFLVDRLKAQQMEEAALLLMQDTVTMGSERSKPGHCISIYNLLFFHCHKMARVVKVV